MTKENLMWFLIGTFAGWVVIYLLVMVGGVTLTVIFGMLPILLPVLAVIGALWLVWYLLKH